MPWHHFDLDANSNKRTHLGALQNCPRNKPFTVAFCQHYGSRCDCVLKKDARFPHSRDASTTFSVLARLTLLKFLTVFWTTWNFICFFLTFACLSRCLSYSRRCLFHNLRPRGTFRIKASSVQLGVSRMLVALSARLVWWWRLRSRIRFIVRRTTSRHLIRLILIV